MVFCIFCIFDMLITLKTVFSMCFLHLHFLHIVLHLVYSFYVCTDIFCILACILSAYFTFSHISHIIFQFFWTGFKLRDNEMPDDMHQGQPANDSPENDNEDPDMPVDQQVVPGTASAVLHLPPFNFHQCIRLLGGSETTMFKALEQMDVHIPAGRVHIERAGGGVRSHKTYSAYSAYFTYLAYFK
jgi:hypothetical protein